MEKKKNFYWDRHRIKKALESPKYNLDKIDSLGETALTHACIQESDLLDNILRYDIDLNAVNSKGNNALIICCMHGVNKIESLVDKGVKLNFKNPDGWTALIASSIYTPNFIKPLINLGANVNVQDNNGKTPLMYACVHQSNSNAIYDLIQGNSRLDLLDNKNKNVFDIAKIQNNGSYEILKSYI